MLRSAKDVQRCPVYATDGDVGDVEALFFDDESWKVRYLVVKAGGLLANRRVLIAPELIGDVDREAGVLYANITREQVKNSPGVEADRPVADQQEVAYYGYYGIDPYWGSGWEVAAPPLVPTYPGAYTGGMHEPSTGLAEEGEAILAERGDPHLRNTKEAAGYRIGAADREVGHVENFVVDDEKWVIRYVGVYTSNWLPGKKVLISPRWISEVSWNRREVYTDLESSEIKSAPEWDPDAPIDHEYEIRLHEHYGRPPYWLYR